MAKTSTCVCHASDNCVCDSRQSVLCLAGLCNKMTPAICHRPDRHCYTPLPARMYKWREQSVSYVLLHCCFSYVLLHCCFSYVLQHCCFS